MARKTFSKRDSKNGVLLRNQPQITDAHWKNLIYWHNQLKCNY